jgi:hypothetical protein
MFNSCGHKTFGWPNLYGNDLDFAATYQTLGASKQVSYFHLQDRTICHVGHLYVPSSEHGKLFGRHIIVRWSSTLT